MCELKTGYPLLAPEEYVHALWNIVDYPLREDQDLETLELVLQRGSVANISNDDSLSLVNCAVSTGDLNILETFLNGGICPHTDESFRLLLSRALRFRGSAISQALLDHEAHFGPCTADPLHTAVNRASIAIVKQLLNQGADVHAATMQGITASKTSSFWDNHSDFQVAEYLTVFQYAALIGQEEIVQLFLHHVADQRATPSEHFAMYLAALLGHHAVVLHFLEHARWLKSPDSDIWHDSLCAAAYCGHNETVKVLLAGYRHVQARGRPLAHYREDIQEIQNHAPAYYDEVIHSASHRGHGETL